MGTQIHYSVYRNLLLPFRNFHVFWSQQTQNLGQIICLTHYGGPDHVLQMTKVRALETESELENYTKNILHNSTFKG